MAILMTGCTGILGSEIGLILAKTEEIFFLVRKESIGKVLSGMDKAKAIIGDIILSMCGISAEDMTRLKAAGISKVLHLAADVSFSPEDKDGKIRRINFDGTRNILDVAKELGVAEFHYCGTCYASTRRNPYETSKDDAEKLVRQSGIPFSIYKPSAMVGDSLTGAANGFNGFCGAFSIFHWIAQKIREKKNCTVVNLPVYVVVSSQSTMNIIPVDWVRDIFVKLFRLGVKNETYYLTHENPPLALWAIRIGFEILNITDIRYLEQSISWKEKEELHTDRGMLVYQKWVDSLLDQFIPYCVEEKKFSLDTVKEALGGDFVRSPEITSEFLRRLFTFAMEKNFGLRIRSPRRKETAAEPSAAVSP